MNLTDTTLYRSLDVQMKLSSPASTPPGDVIYYRDPEDVTPDTLGFKVTLLMVGIEWPRPEMKAPETIVLRILVPVEPGEFESDTGCYTGGNA
jgi:hypothetical protein